MAALWGDVPTQRCTVHKHRNLLAHAPQRLHEEVSADYNDMIYATSAAEIEAHRWAFIRKWRLKCKAVADSLEEAGDRLFTFTRLPVSQWRSARTTNAIERLHESSSAGSRPRRWCPQPRPRPCCSGRCLPLAPKTAGNCGPAQACGIGYFAKISSIRLKAFSAAACGAIPSFMMSTQPTLHTCSFWTWA